MQNGSDSHHGPSHFLRNIHDSLFVEYMKPTTGDLRKIEANEIHSVCEVRQTVVFKFHSADPSQAGDTSCL